MKPPPRKRTRTSRELAPVPQPRGKAVCKWPQAEQRRLLTALTKLSVREPLDPERVREYLPTRTAAEINSVLDALKEKVLLFAKTRQRAERREERKSRKPLAMWIKQASAATGAVEDSLSSAFTQMLAVMSIEPQNIRRPAPTPSEGSCPASSSSSQPPSVCAIPPQTLPAQTLPASTLPTQTPPAQTLPTQTFPVQTFPAQTLPAQTLPAQTLPAQTFPAQTLLAQTLPAQTLPAQTLPAQTLPAQTLPAQTLPAQTLPVQTLSAHTLSAQTLSAQTLPAQTLPAQTLPAQTLPAQTLPAQTLPAQTLPAQTLPAPAFLTQTPPAPAPPAQTPPAQTPPAQTPPAQTPPAQTLPAQTPSTPTPLVKEELKNPAPHPPTAAQHPLVPSPPQPLLSSMRRQAPPPDHMTLVSFEKIYHYLSTLHRPQDQSRLTPMESAVVLDLLMSLPEELLLLDCDKLSQHFSQVYLNLSSSADLRNTNYSSQGIKRQDPDQQQQQPAPEDSSTHSKPPPLLNPFLVPLSLLSRKAQANPK